MGREIKRVPMDFDFPLGESFAEDFFRRMSDEGLDPESDDFPSWSAAIPKGDGWQLWQTVSDGPISPVFATAEELVDWMCKPVPAERRPHYDPVPYPSMPWAQGWRREIAEPFVKRVGWAPSFVSSAKGLQDGPTFAVENLPRGEAEKAE